MRELKALLAFAIAHANENEPRDAHKRSVVLFYLKCVVQDARKLHNYDMAFCAMTLIRIVQSEPTLAPVWKALVAACKDAEVQGPPTPNRGVRLPSHEQTVLQDATIDTGSTSSSAMNERDQQSYDRLSDYLARR